MDIKLFKVNFYCCIVVFIVVFIFCGCSKRPIRVRHIHKRTPSRTYNQNTDSKPANGIGAPYYIDGIQYIPQDKPQNFVQKGIASWYGKKFHGKKTACGERYNMYAMTAAHKTLPLQTWVKVHNLRNNREIVVRINDRGPFVKGRIIDLTYTGAKKLGMADQGTAPVIVTVLGKLKKNSISTQKEYIPVNCFNGNFSIQIGAFQVRANAERLKAKLSRKYDHVHIAAYTDYRGTFYRVRVGKYSDLKEALFLEKQMYSNGHKTIFLIAD